MHARLVYIFILINVLNAFAVPHWINIFTKRTKYCGTYLTSALSLICEGNYYGKTKTMKRTDWSDFYSRLKNHLNSKELEFLPSSQDLAESIVPAKPQGRILEECCDKGCSRDELKAYCAA